VQRGHDRAYEGRLAGAERPSEGDDVAGPERAGEVARFGFERGEVVEDEIRCAQNSVRCFCA
jgi:uncharacterized membrane protein